MDKSIRLHIGAEQTTVAIDSDVEAVERLFDLLAAWSLGRPAVVSGIPTDAGFAATLLILREFMHHLHFACIQVLRRPVDAKA